MKRRQLLAGLGAVAASGAAIGTGAFTSVEADRSVSVTVADEDRAYLALSPTEGANSTFVYQDSSTNKQLTIDINDANTTEGDGVGLNSVYEFDDVFQIENQGTQEVDVSIDELTNTDFDPNADGLTVQFYPGSDADSPLHDTPVTLGTGNSIAIGLKVETEDPEIKDFNADATVSADAT